MMLSQSMCNAQSWTKYQNQSMAILQIASDFSLALEENNQNERGFRLKLSYIMREGDW